MCGLNEAQRDTPELFREETRPFRLLFLDQTETRPGRDSAV